MDLLVLGLGYADVYFHNSKVGRVVGQMKEVWENYIDWRIMRMVEEGAKNGHRPSPRGHQEGSGDGVDRIPFSKVAGEFAAREVSVADY